MSKRRQTTGLPKSQSRTKKAAETDSKGHAYRSQAEREAQIQRYVIWATGAAIAFVLIVVAVALVFDQFINPSRTVAEVNGTKISAGDFEERVKFERLINIESIGAQINTFMDFGLSFEEAGQQVISFDPYASYWEELNVRDQMGLRVLNDMIDDDLVRSEAERLGITVTREDIEREIRDVFAIDEFGTSEDVEPEATEEPSPTPTEPFVSPTPSPTATITPTPEVEPTVTVTPFPTIAPVPTRSPEEREEIFQEDLDNFYDKVRRDAGMSREEVDKVFEARALRSALAEVVVEPDTTTAWVDARHILVEAEEDALDILDALNNGESFADLAVANSTDTGSGAQGGELGWADSQGYVEEFGDATRTLEIGAISEPVQTDFGFHIIQVRAREERDLEENRIQLNREEAFADWLDELRDSEGVDVEISDIWPDYVPTTPLWTFERR